jgi:hypothetical protein
MLELDVLGADQISNTFEHWQGGASGEGAAAADEAEAEDLPAYQFRMGLGDKINHINRTQYEYCC